MLNDTQKQILELGGRRLANRTRQIHQTSSGKSLKGRRLTSAIVWLTGREFPIEPFSAKLVEALRAELESQRKLEARRLQSRHPYADENRHLTIKQALNGLGQDIRFKKD